MANFDIYNYRKELSPEDILCSRTKCTMRGLVAAKVRDDLAGVTVNLLKMVCHSGQLRDMKQMGKILSNTWAW